MSGKTVLLRVDINVPYEEKTGKISESDRLKEHAKTVKEISDKGAKLVILSHQGRKGDPDFIHLDQHAKLLGDYAEKDIKFVKDVIGDGAKDAIKSLDAGDVLLLDNVRLLDDETDEKKPEKHKESKIVKNLSPLADVFVNDAFSAAHRSHASVVGFTATLPSYAGRAMANEVENLEKIIEEMKKSEDAVFVLGGAKPEEPLDVMNFMLKEGMLGRVLVSGIVGELFLMAKGIRLGSTEEFLKKKEHLESLPEVQKIWETYGSRIETPIDVAFQVADKREEAPIEELPTDSMILDIGTKTIERYKNIIKAAPIIGLKGPAGKYEEDDFILGTKAILETVADCGGVSFVGGGHTLEAMNRLGIDRSKFTHVSLGGGSFIKFLSGKKMPAIEALEAAAKKQKKTN